MSATTAQSGAGYSVAQPGDGYLWIRRSGQLPGVGPGIVCLHGRGGGAQQYVPYHNKLSIGYFAQLLAREGFRVLAIDDQGGTDWGSQDSTDRIADAVAWLQDPTKGGAKAGKVGVMGWSMGGMAALNWVDQNVAKHACSWLWAPATDLAWAHSQAAWTAEIDAAYADDEGYAVAVQGGNNPAAVPQNYRDIGKIRCAQAVDDATIPIQKTRDFVTAVNHADVTITELANGGHSNLFSNVTDLELVQFYRDNLGVPAS